MDSWPWALGVDGKYHAYSSGLSGSIKKRELEISVMMVLEEKDPNNRARAKFGTACGHGADFYPTGDLYPGFMVLTRYVARVPSDERRCSKCAEKTKAR